MLFPGRRVQTVTILTLPVRPVVSNDLGEGYAKGLGYAFCGDGTRAGKKQEKLQAGKKNVFVQSQTIKNTKANVQSNQNSSSDIKLIFITSGAAWLLRKCNKKYPGACLPCL